MRSTAGRARPSHVRLGLAFAAAIFAIALVLSPVRAESPPTSAVAADILAHAPVEIRSALGGAERAERARAAFGRIVASGRIPDEVLRGAMHNPQFAPYVVDTLIDLEAVHDVPGVDRVLTRIASARDDAGPRGASFEISVGARLKPELAELSAEVNGYEVDARLHDGTLVEVKFIQGRHSGDLVSKAIDQLELRGKGQGKPVMLVVNRPLDATQLTKIRTRLGKSGIHSVKVLEASRTGELRTQTPALRPAWSQKPIRPAMQNAAPPFFGRPSRASDRPLFVPRKLSGPN